MMNGLDLFSGIGGLSLALEPYVKTVGYCEIDPYCRSVLAKRIRDGSIDDAPVFYDVCDLYAEHIREPVDIIFGGFPCQDISLAGRRAGLDGERSGLYREVIRLVDECRPTFVFLENVAAIRGHAWRVVQDLARLGFDCRWTSLSAAEVGAPHKRDRWWLLAAHPKRLELRLKSGWSSGADGQSAPLTIDDGKQGPLADAQSNGRQQRIGEPDSIERAQSDGRKGDPAGYDPASAPVADTNRLRELQPSGGEPEQWGRSRDSGGEDLTFYWATEPDVGRVANGIPARVDRLRALGNAVVPAQAREAFQRLMGLK